MPFQSMVILVKIPTNEKMKYLLFLFRILIALNCGSKKDDIQLLESDKKENPNSNSVFKFLNQTNYRYAI